MHVPTTPALDPQTTMSWSLVSRPLRASFGISRGAKRYATSLRVRLQGPRACGHGESVPYARYGERLCVVARTMRDLCRSIPKTQRVDEILAQPGGGCVREAIDAARWDLLCKEGGLRIYDLLGLNRPQSVRTCYTVSLERPEAMAEQARTLGDFARLKLKLGGDGRDIERIEAVAAARPDATLLADANEAWDPAQWPVLGQRAQRAGLVLLEQPFAAGADQVLALGPRPLPCFADESVHGPAELAGLRDRYDGVNIKLGKCGGLDRGLEMVRRARALGFSLMVGCMVGSSRSLAPAVVLASLADEVDLDAHLWLRTDVRPSLQMRGDEVLADFDPDLWG